MPYKVPEGQYKIVNIEEVYNMVKTFKHGGMKYKDLARLIYGMTAVPFSGATIKRWLEDENTAPIPVDVETAVETADDIEK